MGIIDRIKFVSNVTHVQNEIRRLQIRVNLRGYVFKSDVENLAKIVKEGEEVMKQAPEMNGPFAIWLTQAKNNIEMAKTMVSMFDDYKVDREGRLYTTNLPRSKENPIPEGEAPDDKPLPQLPKGKR